MKFYDYSEPMKLALASDGDGSNSRYVPMEERPALVPIDPSYLRQRHTVANGVIQGLIAYQRAKPTPEAWEVWGANERFVQSLRRR